ncbi:MAG: MFS transporter [Chitinophagales bacterium]
MKQERFILFLLATINFTNIVDVMIMMPLGDVFMKLYDISPQQFSWLVSSYALGAFFSSLTGMFLIDRFDRKKALLFIYCGFTIGTFLCAFAFSYVSFLIIRFTTGIFGGMIGALVLSVVSDIYPFERRGSAMGILTAAFSAAAALGVPLGLFLAEKFDWYAPFLFVSGTGIIILTQIVLRFPVMTEHLQHRVKNKSLISVVTDITTDSNQLYALLLGIILVLGHFIIIPFIAPYMIRNVGFTQGQITWMYFAGGLATVFSAPIIGKLTDRFGALKLFYALMIISFIPVLLITNMPPIPVLVALIATTLFFILGSGRMIPPQAMITASVGPKNRGSFMSVKSAFQQLGIFLASIISGALVVDNGSGTLSGYHLVGYLSIGISLIGLLLAKKLKVAAGN